MNSLQSQTWEELPTAEQAEILALFRNPSLFDDFLNQPITPERMHQTEHYSTASTVT
jgi:hypothetical protein